MIKILMRCVILCISLTIFITLFTSCTRPASTNHVHSFGEWETTQNPTCTTNGEKTRYCSCGEIQTANILSTGHTEVVDLSVPATCYSTGLTEGKHCAVCQELLIAQEITNTLDHTWGNPTCTTVRSCLICWTVDEDGEPLGHSYVDGECRICGDTDPESITPTVYADRTSLYMGYETETIYCTLNNWDVIEYMINNPSIVDCEWGEWDGNTIPLTFYPISNGQTYVNIYPEGCDTIVTIYVTVNMPAETYTPHNHSYTTSIIEPSCTDFGYTKFTCNCGYTYNDNYTSALGHTIVVDEYIEPTLESTGLTEGQHCEICNIVLVEQKIIPQLQPSPAENTRLTILGTGAIYNYYILSDKRSSTYISSGSYEVKSIGTTYIEIQVDLIAELIYAKSEYIAFRCELYNSNGICVKSSQVFKAANVGTQYNIHLTLPVSEADHYTLKILDY